MNQLQKLKHSREAIEIVGKLKDTGVNVLEKARLARRLNQLVIALGGTVKKETAEAVSADDLSDNSNDENYRWKDTAYIGGARKFMYQTFSEAKKEGRNIKSTEIDWNDLEKDKRLAETMITKKNIFGNVNWGELRDAGMPSNVAYLVNRVFRAVDKAPLVPLNIESCQNYVKGVSTLRERLEACRSYDDVAEVLVDINKFLCPPKYLIKLYESPTEKPVYDVLNTLEGRIYTELGVRLYSWFRKSANLALHECKTNRDRKTYTESKGATWDWIDSKKQEEFDGKTKPKRQRYHLAFADVIERVGGKPIDLNSSKQLEEMFNFRGVQSGNWVLKDRESAEFHMKSTAEAMLDMGDILGIDAEHLGLKGNLAMAFGARGKGGALAHYERTNKVINITKVKGGGSLGHEYFHALDNLINDLSTGEVGTSEFFGTENFKDIKDPELSSAFKGLSEALFQKKGTMQYLSKIGLSGTYESNQRMLEFYERSVNNLIIGLKLDSILDAHKLSIEELSERAKQYYIEYQRGNTFDALPSIESQIGKYLTIRHFKVGDVKHHGDMIEFPFAPSKAPSDLYRVSMAMDAGKDGKYWSSGRELSARAFSAYLEDKLHSQGRKNTYLAYGTLSTQEDAPLYPQGEERSAVNDAFDKVFKVIREKDVFKSASNNKALMDSIFGESNIVFSEIVDPAEGAENEDLIANEFDDEDAIDVEETDGETLDINTGLYDSMIGVSSSCEGLLHLLYVHFIEASWLCEDTKHSNAKKYTNQSEVSEFMVFDDKQTCEIRLFQKGIFIASLIAEDTYKQDAIDFINTYIQTIEAKLENYMPLVSDMCQKDDDIFAMALRQEVPQPEEELQINDLLVQSASTSVITLDQPTQEQLINNEYTPATINVGGLIVAIENPIDSVRRGVDENGNDWETIMTAHYGYICNTIGADGDELDVFIANNTPIDYKGTVFVISQLDSKGRFDEHKCILGVTSKALALALYNAHYDENNNGVSRIQEFTLDVFKEKIKSHTAMFDSIQSGMLDSWIQDGHYELVPKRKIDLSCLDKSMIEAKATVKEPIVVLEKGSKYYVIHGANRLEIADKNSEIYIPAIIFNSKDGCDKKIVDTAIRKCGKNIHAETLALVINELLADKAEKDLLNA